MGNTYTKWQTDEFAEVEGVWVEIDADTMVKVAAFNNPAHERSLRRLRKPYRQMLRAGRELDPKIQEEIAIKSMVDGILKGWQGVTGPDGEPLEFNTENATRVLSDLKGFRDTVAFLAMEQETFNRAALEDARKNLPSGSDGSSGGKATRTKEKSSAS